MEWGSLEKKVTQPNLNALWNFKGPETVSKKYWLKPGGIRLQTEPGECQKSKSLKPVAQKAQPSTPWWTELQHSWCTVMLKRKASRVSFSITRCGQRAFTCVHAVSSSSLDAKLQLSTWCSPTCARPGVRSGQLADLGSVPKPRWGARSQQAKT